MTVDFTPTTTPTTILLLDRPSRSCTVACVRAYAPRICRGMPARRSIDRDLTRAPAVLQCRARRSPGRPGRFAGIGKLSRAPPARRQGCHCHYRQPYVPAGEPSAAVTPRCGNETSWFAATFQPQHRLLIRTPLELGHIWFRSFVL